MARIWNKVQDLMLLFLVILSLVELSSSGGYSCNCDCGFIAGGGRCSLLLPSVEYLKNGGTCQAIQLATTTHHCIKHKHLENERTCWSMPRTACMCREPTGDYNLMCECDGNRGIFCGSEQNNCVCSVLVEDKNVAITIGIGVGSSVVGIFVLTFIITIIYFIRKYQKSKDPWYQFDKQFKRFTALKEKQKAMGLIRPRQARPVTAAHSAPSKSEDAPKTQQKVDMVVEHDQPLLEIYTTPSKSKSRSPDNADGKSISQWTDSNWLLASKTDLLDISDQSREVAQVDQVLDTEPEAASTHNQSDVLLPNESNFKPDSSLPAHKSGVANESDIKSDSSPTEHQGTLLLPNEINIKTDSYSGPSQSMLPSKTRSNVQSGASESIYQGTLPLPLSSKFNTESVQHNTPSPIRVPSIRRDRKLRKTSKTLPPGPRFYSSDSVVVHHDAFVNHGHENDIYETLD